MRCIELTGSDDRLDCQDMFYDPLNPLPPKCPSCKFPDLDYVPQPYYLVKSRTMTPNEMALAENGNLLVRERIRRVFEALAPGECAFYPTCYKGTSTETPWLLAVPTNQVVTATVDPAIPRCPNCGEPRSAHPGTQFKQWLWNRESEKHIVQGSTWGSSELGWDQWIDRDLYMSVRLFLLLKKIKAAGLNEATCQKLTSANKEEAAWIKEKLRFLEEQHIPLLPPGAVSDADIRWLRDFIKQRAGAAAPPLDIKAAEKRLRFKLPKSYVEFIAKVGPTDFENVDEETGFTAHILTPDEFDSTSYRAGALDAVDEETNSVDGVMFGSTGHGDCFCFDVRRDRKEFQVFLYKHEYNQFEPYADNFAACVRRFAESNGG